MASKRQLVHRVKALEDSIAFEKAKTRSAVKVITKLRGGEPLVANRIESYWHGYWNGHAAGMRGDIPTVSRQRLLN